MSAAVDRLTASAVAQGHPPTVTDPRVLASVAVLIAPRPKLAA